MSARTVDQGVAAVENAQGAQGFQAVGCGFGSALAGTEDQRRSAFEPAPKPFEPAAIGSEPDGRIAAAQAAFSILKLVGCRTQAPAERALRTKGEFVKALCAAVQAVFDTAENGSRAQPAEALLRAKKLEATAAEQTVMQAGDVIVDPMLGGGEDFGGGGRGRSTKVGSGVCDGAVGGVADAGDYGEGGGGDGAGDLFVVEAVQVFPGASTTRDENHFGVISVSVEPAQAGGDFGRAVGPLNGCRVDQKLHGGVPAAADFYDIAQGGALQAGDDADAAGKGGQWPFAVEEAFTAELLLQALDLGQKGAEAGLLHPFGDYLHLAAALVHRKLAVELDGVAIPGAKAEERGLAAEENGGELGAGILQGEIAMAAGSGAPVGNFAFNRNARVAVLHHAADLAHKPGDGPDLG